MIRFFRRRALGSLVIFALAMQLACANAPLAWAQAGSGRAGSTIIFERGAAGGARRSPTVESASREAQEAIRACDDRAALLCVADVLTRYAATLHQIAQERRRHPRPVTRRTP